MNKKFFFQHFIRYSLSCEDFFSVKNEKKFNRQGTKETILNSVYKLLKD